MSKIGLIDVDGHNFPNLALMRISAYHKSIGDSVDWWWSDLEHYDVVYKSKIFSDAYSKDIPDPFNVDKIIKGGTGYCIKIGGGGTEFFDSQMNNVLPDEIEKMFPDYSIYPQYDFAVSMTSRGCPRGCAFCHVKDKEGRASIKVADVSDFWNGQQVIQCCDPNLTACREKRDLFAQYRELSEKHNVKIEFNQGLDIRLLNDADIDDLKHMKVQRLHFAWDNPDDDLREKFKSLADQFGGKGDSHGDNGTVYCLTNFGEYSVDEHIQRALDRIYFLKSYGFAPFVMIYNKPNAPHEIKRLQRWCNNKFVFYSTDKFEDYDGKR